VVTIAVFIAVGSGPEFESIKNLVKFHENFDGFEILVLSKA
jgi:hypothetical protein